MIRAASSNVHWCMGKTNASPELPEGYRLDLTSDPDAPALRRADGAVVARFAARGMTRGAVEQEALEDLLRASRHQRRGAPRIRPGGGGEA